MIAQGLKFILKMAATILLARLLSPEDYGLIGMVAVVINFVGQFKDLGLSVATVQRAEIDHNQVSTMFWINVALSCLIMGLCAALAPVLAWFYGEPRLSEITLVLAVTFFISGLSVQHQALLRRQMRFATLAQIDIISMFISTSLGIVAAWYGAGYWSLVVLQISAELINTVGVWLTCSWRPGPPVRRSGVRPLLVMGSNFTGFSILTYIAFHFDDILIGWQLGAQELGLYDKAYQLLLIPLVQISIPIRNVAVPTLSHLQTEIDRYRAYYHKALLLMTTFGMPLVAFTFVAADNLILVLLGEQWENVVPLFRVLALAGFLSTFSMAAGWVFISFGRTDRQFRWSIIASTVTAIAFIIGLQWGTIGIAAAYSISRLIIQPLEIVYCYRGLPLRISELVNTLSRPAFASLSAAAAVFAIDQTLLGGMDRAIALLVTALFYGLFYLGVWTILPNGRQTLGNMFQLIKELRRKPKKPENAE